jgi:hypothetical protein
MKELIEQLDEMCPSKQYDFKARDMIFSWMKDYKVVSMEDFCENYLAIEEELKQDLIESKWQISYLKSEKDQNILRLDRLKNMEENGAHGE